MTTRQYDVLYPRRYSVSGQEKTHWMNVGKAFDARNGGIDVVLYVIPPPVADGTGYRFLIREEDRERQQQHQARGPQHRERGSFQGGSYGPQRGAAEHVPMPGGDDDNIPF